MRFTGHALLAFLLCSTAYADEGANAPDDPAAAAATTLPGVNVTNHYDNAVGTSDAASQGVILGQLLQDIPLQRPGEVLESVPGLVVTQHSGEGNANQYFLRGYNLDHGTDFATSVDGVPVNMPTNAHGQGYMDLNFLIPELVQRIDYRKSTYFAENGDFSAAGSADIYYRNSLDPDIADLTFGGFGYRRLLLAGSVPVSLPDWARIGDGGAQGPTLLAAVEGLEQNGPWRTAENMHKFNGLLRLSDGDSARGWSVDMIAYEARWTSTDQVPLASIESGRLCRYCAIDPSDGGDSARNILSGEWHSHDDDGYLKISAYLQHYRLQLFSNFTYFEERPDTGDQFEQREVRNLLGTKIAKGWNHTLFGRPSTTEVGLQIRHDNIHVGLFNSEDRVAFETVTDDLVSETESALYVENTTIWTDHLRSLVGVREDHIAMDLTSLVATENSGHAAASRVSPKLSLIFGPWAQTEFFVNAGNGFHSNDARGAIYRTDPGTGEPATAVPPLVGAFGQEPGVRTEIVPGLQTSLALWRLNSESELVYGADSGSTEPNGASKRHGVELNNHLVLSDWLLFDADLAWTHARYANPNDNGERGDFIPNAVRKVAALGVRAHDLGPWSANVKLRYIGKYPLSQDGSSVGPAAVVTDPRLTRRLNAWAAISLDALSLFNRQYYDIAYAQDYRVSPTSPLVPNGITVHPGEPREFRITSRGSL